VRTALLLRPRRKVLRAIPKAWQMRSSPDSSAGLNSTSTVSVRVAGLRLMVFLLGGADYEDGQLAGVMLGKCPVATF
jgi:hypothetical protein